VKYSENRAVSAPAQVQEASYPYKTPPHDPSASVPSRDAKDRQPAPFKLDINIQPPKR